MRKTIIYFSITIFVLLLISFITLKVNKITPVIQSNSHTIQVVAAENFYGDIVNQLGGSHVTVQSILSDPNVDPHEYESNIQNSIAVAKANIVIKNGDNYDTWMDKLISASPNKNRIILTGADIANHKLPDNPHVWYGINNIQTIARAITNSLKQVDPKHATAFEQNLTNFDNSLTPLIQKMKEIKTKFTGTPVGLTETIYLYQTPPMGLNVLTPLAFEQAVAEGNDPSADNVAMANDQISKRLIKVLIYNKQTVTPITTNLQNEAKANNIPIIPVTETMPTNKHYQSWMMDQLNNLEQALIFSTASH